MRKNIEIGNKFDNFNANEEFVLNNAKLTPAKSEYIKSFFGKGIATLKGRAQAFINAGKKARVDFVKKVGTAVAVVFLGASLVACAGEDDNTVANTYKSQPVTENTRTTQTYSTEKTPSTSGTITVKTPETTNGVSLITSPDTTNITPVTTSGVSPITSPTTTVKTPETTVPVTTPVTTTPETTPVTESDIYLNPAQEGFEYPEEITKMVESAYKDFRVKATNATELKVDGKYIIEGIEPEILFVNVATRLSEGKTISVFARYNLDNEQLYTKYAFDMTDYNSYTAINKTAKLHSYGEYVDAIVACVNKGYYFKSGEVYKERNLNNLTTAQSTKLAGLIDENFVDCDVFGVGNNYDSGFYTYKINGFGYDKEGNANYFESNIKCSLEMASYEQGNEYFISKWFDVARGIGLGFYVKQDFESIDTTSKALDSVYTMPQVAYFTPSWSFAENDEDERDI